MTKIEIKKNQDSGKYEIHGWDEFDRIVRNNVGIWSAIQRMDMSEIDKLKYLASELLCRYLDVSRNQLK